MREEHSCSKIKCLGRRRVRRFSGELEQVGFK